jgi:hypothetical protein
MRRLLGRELQQRSQGHSESSAGTMRRCWHGKKHEVLLRLLMQRNLAEKKSVYVRVDDLMETGE